MSSGSTEVSSPGFDGLEHSSKQNSLVLRVDEKQGTKCRSGDSDCESDTSEVLSVGSEPPPTLSEFRDCNNSAKYEETSRTEFQDEENTRISCTPSPSSSTSCNDPYYHRTSNPIQAPSPPAYSQPPSSPTASSVRSPASSSATASSPGRPDLPQETILSRYQSAHQHLFSRFARDSSDLADYPSRLPHGLSHEIIYPAAERLHRTPISVPLVTRISLSPPSAMTVTVLQASTPVLHPTACRDPRDTLMPHPPHNIHHGLSNSHSHLLQNSQIQHVPATAIHQHRLSVSKILQRDHESVSPKPREENGNGRTGTNSSNGNQNNANAINNNDNHNNNNNNNNLQHQTGLIKFSIDNILKAEFGRRITDPISLKKSRPKKVIPRPIDLTKDFLESSSEGSERGSEASTTNTSPGVPTSNTPTSVSGSQGSEPGKMVWPAWVYCTRYSDRPSSGEFLHLLYTNK
ncbi:putative uncharacterized protein DDB_G0277255 [Leptopilina boulardi]|uniref:putative uncharacterized protein DDB_G0277255 n=1 Tax=Leptopilina boulardi TaxID=63433 RepID=UPI0021F65791|nr:putative uncharacterized protein DDB_G0277255 [Leptopilina boulardi]